ncbi:MAG: hypothetical protein ACOYON_02375 [Fimbriimonas sp.]
MLAVLAASVLSQVAGEAVARDTFLSDPGGQSRLLIKEMFRRINPPKLSPKRFGPDRQSWMFEWITSGYGLVGGDTKQFELRFRIYNQERKDEGDVSPQIAAMLLRMWQMNVDQLRLEHAEQFNRRIVDVYVCYGGKAGGEQLFDVDRQMNPQTKVNTIYFYDLRSFKDPLEMAREVAHEYGHATLPAVGFGEPEGLVPVKPPVANPPGVKPVPATSGVKKAKPVAVQAAPMPAPPKPAPEYWANGILGERLYLMWIRDGMQANLLKPADAMGVTKEQLDKWLVENVEKGVLLASQKPPSKALLGRMDAVGMEEYHRLALYMATILPNAVFARSLKLTGSTEAVDYPQGILLATEEPEKLELTIPGYLAGKTLWVPIGKGVLDGAKELERRDGWAKILPAGGPVSWKNAR